MSQKISFFLPSLQGGGAERVFVNLANEFATRGFSVDLVLAHKEGPYVKNVSKKVEIIDLKSSRVLFSLIPLVKYLRKNKPDTLLSSMEHANIVAIIAKKISRVKTRIVIRVVNNISSSLKGVKRKKKLMILFGTKLFYNLADEIIAISQGVADDLLKTTELRKNINVVYNPTIIPDIHERVALEPNHPWLHNKDCFIVLGVGRLMKQKDFSTLIKAFACVIKNKKAKMIIIGEGEERGKLQKLINELGVEDHVDILGFVDNPYSFMAMSDVFVLSSLWDGLPNAMIEALACGTSVVSTDCPGGVKEILENGKYGKLVPVRDYEALAKVIEETLDNPTDSDLLKERANDFRVEKIADEYLKVMGLK